MTRRLRLFVFAGLTLIVVVIWKFGGSLWEPVYFRLVGMRSVQNVVQTYGFESRERLDPHFQAAGIAYPPASVAMLAFKDTKRFEVWARNGSDWRYIREYPILGASGGLGPKLREGDLQVPEGVYRIEALNPNSAFHLSMKLNYPNAWDLEHAKADGRSKPGTDIFIHGASASIGCLAMGDPAIEELFILVADTGLQNVLVCIAPTDLRTSPLPSISLAPDWVGELYANLAEALQPYQRP